MFFESKLIEILKQEKKNLWIYISIILLSIPFLCWFFNLDHNPNFIIHLIVLSLVYLFLFSILYLKCLIIKKLKWSLHHYIEDATRVQRFLNNRKDSLSSYYGVISLFNLYEEAIILLNELLIQKIA